LSEIASSFILEKSLYNLTVNLEVIELTVSF
jgi:hypothetical protein